MFRKVRPVSDLPGLPAPPPHCVWRVENVHHHVRLWLYAGAFKRFGGVDLSPDELVDGHSIGTAAGRCMRQLTEEAVRRDMAGWYE